MSIGHSHAIVLGGTASRSLKEDICLAGLHMEAGRVTHRRFSDGESHVQIEENVRGRAVYVVQSTCSAQAIVELCIMLDTLKRASAAEVVAVIPYFGYARQDRKVKARTPITAKLMANLLTTAGATKIMTVDLHAGQIQGFFDIPCDNLYASKWLIRHLREAGHGGEGTVIVSPDAGGVERARRVSAALGSDLAIIDKRRPEANVCEVMHVIGEVAGKHAVIVDDMIDTAGTLCKAAEALVAQGAAKVSAAATHGVLSGEALDRLNASALARVWVTNSLDQTENQRRCPRLQVIDLAPLLATAIKRSHDNESLSSLFE